MSLNGKMVRLSDVDVAFAKGDFVRHNPYNLVFSGPHSRFGTISDIAEWPNNSNIDTCIPPAWTRSSTPSISTPSKYTKQAEAEDFFDDLKAYACDHCSHGGAPTCPKTGRPHPTMCADCGLIDCDSVVPFCGSVPAKRHKADPCKVRQLPQQS